LVCATATLRLTRYAFYAHAFTVAHGYGYVWFTFAPFTFTFIRGYAFGLPYTVPHTTPHTRMVGTYLPCPFWLLRRFAFRLIRLRYGYVWFTTLRHVPGCCGCQRFRYLRLRIFPPVVPLHFRAHGLFPVTTCTVCYYHTFGLRLHVHVWCVARSYVDFVAFVCLFVVVYVVHLYYVWLRLLFVSRCTHVYIYYILILFVPLRLFYVTLRYTHTLHTLHVYIYVCLHAHVYVGCLHFDLRVCRVPTPAHAVCARLLRRRGCTACLWVLTVRTTHWLVTPVYALRLRHRLPGLHWTRAVCSAFTGSAFAPIARAPRPLYAPVRVGCYYHCGYHRRLLVHWVPFHFGSCAVAARTAHNARFCTPPLWLVGCGSGLVLMHAFAGFRLPDPAAFYSVLAVPVWLRFATFGYATLHGLPHVTRFWLRRIRFTRLRHCVYRGCSCGPAHCCTARLFCALPAFYPATAFDAVFARALPARARFGLHARSLHSVLICGSVSHTFRLRTHCCTVLVARFTQFTTRVDTTLVTRILRLHIVYAVYYTF